MTAGQLMEKVSALEKEMFEFARDLEFEKAASLRDEVETLRRLVRAVDIEIEIAHLVQGRYRKAPFLEQGCCNFGTRNNAVDAVADAGQHVDEEIDGGPGTHTQYHPRLDEFERGFGGTTLLVG